MALNTPNKLATDFKLQNFSTRNRVSLPRNRNGQIAICEIPETHGASVRQGFVQGLRPDGK
jgi:hypothetical protein